MCRTTRIDCDCKKLRHTLLNTSCHELNKLPKLLKETLLSIKAKERRRIKTRAYRTKISSIKCKNSSSMLKNTAKNQNSIRYFIDKMLNICFY